MNHLLFVHGLGQDAESWNKTISYLSSTIKAQKLSLFKLCEEKTYASLYKAFEEYVNQLSEPVHLCGLSLGAILGLHYSLNYPEKVSSLILIAPQYKMSKNLLSFQNLIFRFLPQKSFKPMNMTKEEVISFTQSMMNLDFTDEIHKIKSDTYIFCGSKDKINLKASKQLTAEITRAKFYLIEGAGHEVNLDQPQELARLINGFFEMG